MNKETDTSPKAGGINRPQVVHEGELCLYWKRTYRGAGLVSTQFTALLCLPQRCWVAFHTLLTQVVTFQRWGNFLL